MTKVAMKPGTMLNPVPVVMVSCSSGEKDNIITVAWTGIVNSEPPMAYVSVRKSRFSHQLITESKEFVVNLTTEDLAKVTDFCGVKSGRNMDKFKETGLTRESAELVSCPMIKESPVNLECKLKDVIEYASHDMFIAEIVKVHADEKLFDEKGKLCLDEAKLLCYNHGEYFGIKRYPLGKFGYSIMKPKTKKRINRERTQKRSTKGKRG